MVGINGSITVVRDFVKQNLTVRSSLRDDPSGSRLQRPLQHFLSKRFSNRFDDRVYQCVVTHALEAEKTYAGCGMSMLKHWTGLSDDQPLSRPKSASEIRDALTSQGLSQETVELLMAGLVNGSLSGNMTIKKTHASAPYVEISEGRHFEVKPMTSRSRSILTVPSVLCVDGYIETVAEIHHLLQHLSQTRQACLLFVRGTSNDVIHTVQVNNDRGTLSLHVLQVPFDIEHANDLVDIATAVDSDVVSSLKGDLISAVDVSKLPVVNSAIIGNDSVTLKNHDTERLRSHVLRLKEKQTERPDLIAIYAKRIRSLMSVNIEFGLPDDFSFSARSMELDEGIRLITSMLRNPADPTAVSRTYSEKLQRSLTDIGFIVT